MNSIIVSSRVTTSAANTMNSIADAALTGARGNSGIIMALEHVSKPLWGVQFHPESVMTKGGHRMLANWLALCGNEEALALAEGKAPLVRG